MDRDRAVTDLRREGTVVIELGTGGDLDARVPSCPGWTYADLLGHLGNVYNWAGTILTERLTEPPDRAALPTREEGVTDLDWMADRFDRVTTALDAIPLDAEIWNFGPHSPGSAEFWWRRQLHETIIHRVDAESSRNLPLTPIDPALAADGIDELFTIYRVEDVPPEGFTEAKGLWVHLHAADVEHAEWTVDTGARTVTRAHLKGDVAVRGPAWALLRWLWGRPVGGELDTFGDLDAAEAWRRTVVT
jgi:uncharacterized protein (TIGR03083 family)